MTAKNFTLYNYSSTTATLNQITFVTPVGIQHIADLSAFGGYLAGQSAFTGTGTYPVEPATYQSDTRPENAIYVAHYNTASNFYLIVDSTTRIQPSWIASDNGYTSGQSVVSVTSSTWLRMSAAPTFAPTVGQAISFSTSTIQLTVDNTTGISAGFVAVGNGYSIGQTVVSVVSGSVLQMSAYPNGIPSVGGTINFENRSPIGTLAPGGSIPFSVDHTTSLTSVGTYTTRIDIIGNVNGPKTKVVRNAVVLSTVPVVDPGNIFFDPGGGGGDAGPGACADSASASCSASGAGGGECFTGDTLINVAGGKTKRIDQIQIGDLVIDALTGNANKVIGVKVTEYEAGRRLFATKKGVKPFITEQHAFYDDNELCAMSSECEYLAPWLGKVKVVDVPEIETAAEDITVYNLMFETGNSHYANGVPVSNMVGHGGTYVLMQKGFITEEEYKGYIYHLENTVGLNSLSQEQKAKVFKIVFKLSKYILNNDNLQSRMLARLMSWAIRNRTTLYPYMEKWFKSRIRNIIFGRNK
jgi:hypothetical protein